jgi:hypothetical protein
MEGLEDPKPAGFLGLHTGFSKARDAKDGNFLGGVHGELLFLRWLGVQGAVDYRSDEHFIATMGATNAELNVRTIPVTVSGKLYAPVTARFWPYGLVGGGWYHVLFDYSNDLEALGFSDRDVSTFGWHVGLGGSALLSPRLGAFVESRWVFVDPDNQLDDATFERIEDLDFDSLNLMAGLNFIF